jgi:hypothetical protein
MIDQFDVNVQPRMGLSSPELRRCTRCLDEQIDQKSAGSTALMRTERPES